MPTRVSTSSVWPLPSTPAMPSTSPAWMSKLMSASSTRPSASCSSMSRTESSTRSVTVDSSVLGDGSSLPTISSASWCAVTSAGLTEVTVVPRRITVISSATASTSSSLWEMKIRVCPCRLELAQVREERVHLLRHQHGRRLVEDDDLRAAVEHLEDLHPLALADAERLDELVGVELEAVALGDLDDLGPRSVADAVQLLGTEDDVLQDGEVVGQHEVLEDHADALRDRVRGRGEDDLRAVDADRPVVRLLHAVQDLHQGGLAGAVLPDQGVDRPAADRDVDVMVRDDTGEPLADAPELDGSGCITRCCSCGRLGDRGHDPS